MRKRNCVRSFGDLNWDKTKSRRQTNTLNGCKGIRFCAGHFKFTRSTAISIPVLTIKLVPLSVNIHLFQMDVYRTKRNNNKIKTDSKQWSRIGVRIQLILVNFYKILFVVSQSANWLDDHDGQKHCQPIECLVFLVFHLFFLLHWNAWKWLIFFASVKCVRILVFIVFTWFSLNDKSIVDSIRFFLAI